MDDKVDAEVNTLTERLESMREVEVYEKELMTKGNMLMDIKVDKFMKSQLQEQSDSQLNGSGIDLFKGAMKDHMGK